MLRKFSVNFAILYMLVDAALIFLAMWVAVVLRPLFNPWQYVQEIPVPLILPPLVYLLAVLVWILVLLTVAVYDGRKNLRVVDELTNLTIGAAIAFVSLAGVLYLSYREVSRLLYLLFGAQAYVYLLLWRLLVRLVLRWRGRAGVQTRRVLIVGAGQIGQELRRQLLVYPYFGLEFAGFLDDDPAKKVQDAPVLGPVDETRQLALQLSVSDVVLALPQRAYARIHQLVGELHDLPVKVWVIPDYFSLALHRAQIEELAGIPLIDLRAPALSEYQRLLKRVFDLLVLAVIFVPACLVMGGIALVIWLDDPGPVLFRQTRLGENGRLFKMFKFRTMVVGAEEMQHLVDVVDDEGRPLHKVPNDPRLTRVGCALRRSSLDELPQLFNVLKGNMSLVGPRPELPHLVAKYQRWQRKRFAVPQGVTGWWQVNGRSDKPMHLHTEDDLYYVQNYSLMLDINILIRTIWVVLRGKGAY